MSQDKVINKILEKTGGRNNVVFGAEITAYNPDIALEYDLAGNVSRIKETFNGQTLYKDLTWVGDVLVSVSGQKLLT